MHYKRRLKPFVIPTLYGLSALAFIFSIYFLKKAFDTPVFDEEDDYIYVNKTIFDEDTPVVGNSKSIIRPYTATDIKIVKDFYSKDDDAPTQQKSLIFYEGTYMQNSGIDYSGKDNFDVVSILDGTVTNVNENNLLGKTIEVRHSNELISTYQSLSAVNIKQGDKVTQGQLIGKSGVNNLSVDIKDHLHFEIIYNGQNLDPEQVYDKAVEDL
jgi:stage II sporulation protein Q